MTPDGAVVLANPALAKMLGYAQAGATASGGSIPRRLI